jgi:hypothetical protein
LVTDRVTLEDVRMTNDVDLIFTLVGYSEWMVLQKELLGRGFICSPEDDIICRLRLGDLIVDSMPDDASILGFSNRWYKKGIETALTHELAPDLVIRHLTSPLFIATKLEAHLGRGNNDPLGSRDLEDILIVLDGRKELGSEIEVSDADIRHYIATQFRAFQDHIDFDTMLEGNIRGPRGRADIVRARIAAIADYC